MKTLLPVVTYILTLPVLVPAYADLILPKSVRYRSIFFLHKDHKADGNTVHELRMELESREALGDNSSFYMLAKIYADQRSLSSGVINQFHDRMSRRPAVNVTEGYIETRFPSFDLRMGKQIINWGQGIGFNPTDRFGVFDYTDLGDPERLGVMAWRSFHYHDDYEIELVAVPFYSPSRLGQLNTRWRPLIDGQVPIPVNIDFPANHPRNGGFGARLRFPVFSWDMTLSYSRTVDDVSGSQRIVFPVVTPLFHHQRTVGFDASTQTSSGWEAHIEAAVTQTPSGKDDDYLQYIFGASRSWPDIVSTHDINLTLEWAGEYITSRRTAPNVNDRNLIQRPFPGSLLIDAELEVTEFNVWKLRGSYTFKGSDVYAASIEWRRRMSDRFEFRAGFDALAGKGSALTAAQYKSNDRLRAETIFYF